MTTEKPTEPTAPSPTAPTNCAIRNVAYPSANALPPVPAAQSSVPTMSSGLRLVRSPTYAQATAATALTRKLTAVTRPSIRCGTSSAVEIGPYSGGTRPIATLSSEASTTKTTTL